ncbi:MAG: GH3 auxin-responsive promoter family protein [Fibrobacteres bacterium]|jgi:hypothetical protein|nr:GH3 auxin-responsive promoter family protein [Fibrobacterota bacterium]
MANLDNHPFRSAVSRLLSRGIRSSVPAPCRAQEDILASQSRQLRRILRSLVGTESANTSPLRELSRLAGEDLLEAFRRQVPLRQYGDVASAIDRMRRGERDVLFRGKATALAQTSGTTSAEGSGERWIPQNKPLLDHHAKGGMTSLARLLESSGPGVLDGRLLMLGGSTALTRNEAGIPVGDLSGITVDRIPWFLEGLYEPGRDLALESIWSRKVERIAQRLCDQHVTLVSGIPSWCLVLFEAICQRRGVHRLGEAWPGLRAMIHGGVSIDPYLPLLAEHLPRECLLMEVYPASEAFLAVGTRAWSPREGHAPDLELLLDHGTYLEFLPESESDPTQAVDARKLEKGGLYKVLVTTPGGLIRYEIGDLVEGRDPGRIRFAGRVRTRLSVFGEHVEGTHLSEALASASQATNSVVREWHVAPILPAPGSPWGAHEWWIEFERPPADTAALARCLDDHLRRTVLDYDAHREGDTQLLPPRVRVVSAGTFLRTLASRGKLGGQHKVPTAWPDRTWADSLTLHDRISAT